jgi:DNA-binding MarR family transcriptional regulator
MGDGSGNCHNPTEDSPDQDPLNTSIVHAFPEWVLSRRAYLLGRLGREARRRFARRRFAQLLSAWNLNASHYGVLLLLEEIDQASQQHLAQMLSIDRANMVALLDLLQERGLIERATDSLDRRRHLVKLTAIGRQEMQQIRQAEEGLDEALFEGLDTEEQTDLHRLLVKLFNSLTHKIDTKPSNTQKEEHL